MAHILNKMTAPIEAVKKQLEVDKESHAAQGMYLEHLWVNDDNPDEVFFLFRVDDLNQCKNSIEKVYEKVRKENPDAVLPEKVYLNDSFQ